MQWNNSICWKVIKKDSRSIQEASLLKWSSYCGWPQTDKGGGFETHLDPRTGQQQLSTSTNPRINMIMHSARPCITWRQRSTPPQRFLKQFPYKCIEINQTNNFKAWDIPVSIALLLDISLFNPYIYDSLKSQTIWPRIPQAVCFERPDIIIYSPFLYQLIPTRSISYRIVKTACSFYIKIDASSADIRKIWHNRTNLVIPCHTFLIPHHIPRNIILSSKFCINPQIRNK